MDPDLGALRSVLPSQVLPLIDKSWNSTCTSSIYVILKTLLGLSVPVDPFEGFISHVKQVPTVPEWLKANFSTTPFWYHLLPS